MAAQCRRRPRKRSVLLRIRQSITHPERDRSLYWSDHCNGATATLNRIYRESGVPLPSTLSVSEVRDEDGFRKALVIAPPSAAGSACMRRFGDYSDAFASGWMLLRGARRRRAVDRGFVLSDHADWPGLMHAIEATGATRVVVTHGYVDIMVRWLLEGGLDASAFST